MSSNLRINMTGTESDPVAAARRYQSALDMAAYADANGFDSVNVEEHHCADNGWLPSPLTMAAAIAARTETCSIGIMALLVSLYDPVRLAEDLAVIDLISNGRLNFVPGCPPPARSRRQPILTNQDRTMFFGPCLMLIPFRRFLHSRQPV